ncbi:hypothetical protein [Nocardiopsis alborubida]|uniref:hypothetical protein n=1 Tax=Nocardiopsis alborubida TaxID=146802 RepID=UPI001E386B75|nr:hypothetical protein [Nocardiopsis alborubida]
MTRLETDRGPGADLPDRLREGADGPRAAGPVGRSDGGGGVGDRRARTPGGFRLSEAS